MVGLSGVRSTNKSRMFTPTNKALGNRLARQAGQMAPVSSHWHPSSSRFTSVKSATPLTNSTGVTNIHVDAPKANGGTFLKSHVKLSDINFDTDKAHFNNVESPFNQVQMLASIRYLEEKVDKLENSRHEAEQTIQYFIAKEKRLSHGGDSALGSLDGNEKSEGQYDGQSKLALEKNGKSTTVMYAQAIDR